jgi:hypothetical protein
MFWLCSGPAGPDVISKLGAWWMFEARFDRAAVPLRAAVSWILSRGD